MKQIIGIFSLVVIAIFFQNCDPYHSDLKGLSSSSNGFHSGATLDVDQNLQNQSLAILSAKCASCHGSGTSGGVSQILNVTHLIEVQLVVPGNPTQGRLIGSIADGSMPVGTVISSTELTTLRNWISSMRWVGTPPPSNPPSSPLPAGKVVRADSVLHGQAITILNINCAGCHQGAAEGGISNILDINRLTASGILTPGDPTKGRLIGSINDGTMPKGNGANVTSGDLAILKNWINSMTIVNENPSLPPLPARAALMPTFAGINAHVIQPKCLGCHGPVLAKDNLNLSTYNAVKSQASKILSECKSDKMPIAPYPFLTTDELSALQAWIDSGALNN